MNYNRRAAIAEDGARVVAKRHVWRDNADVGAAVLRDDQSKVGNISGRNRVVVMIHVSGGAEVRASGLEVWSFALGDLMDVHGVLASGDSFDVEFDFYSMSRFGKSSGADRLAFGVLEFGNNRFCCRVRVRILGNGLPGCRKTRNDSA